MTRTMLKKAVAQGQNPKESDIPSFHGAAAENALKGSLSTTCESQTEIPGFVSKIHPRHIPPSADVVKSDVT